MSEFIDNISGSIVRTWNEMAEFFYQSRNNPFLWIALFLIGMFLCITAFNALNKD